MVNEEDAVEIHEAPLIRGFVLAIAMVGTFGVLMQLFFAPYEKPVDIAALYFVSLVNLPLAWWIGIFN